MVVVGVNTAICLIAGGLACWKKLSVGSGIPHIKAYLNGIKIKGLLSLRTVAAKILGVVCSVLGGLPVGKEGPMIHSGAGMGSFCSQGVFNALCNYKFKCFQQNRNDRAKRDFIAAGSAAGVSAAFGAPIAGVLFAIEEGASFYDVPLIVNLLISSLTSFFVLNLIKSAVAGRFGELSNGGLMSFGTFKDASYTFVDFGLFIVMGFAGGALGALYNYINKQITIFRSKYVHTNARKLLEVAVAGATVTGVAFFAMLVYQGCSPIPSKLMGTKDIIQFYCPMGKMHEAGNICELT